MAGRVSQTPIEVVTSGDANTARLSHLAIEVVTDGANPNARFSQLAIEAVTLGEGAIARFSQLAIECVMQGNEILVYGASGIATSVAFGSGGTVANDGLGLVGSAGIPSSVAFGADGEVWGPQYVTGSAGIASSVAFGADGTLADIYGTAGIPSSVAFGSGGSLGLNIEGSAGIPSSVAFGDGSAAPAGVYLVVESGVGGIASSVAFGSGGSVDCVIAGTAGIPSSVAFGLTGTVVNLDPEISRFGLYINGVNRTDYLRESTWNVQQPLNFNDQGSFQLFDDDNLIAPQPGEPVVMLHLPEGGTSWLRIFGGSIENTVRTKNPTTNATETWFDCRCVGYAYSLARRIVTKNYDGATYGNFTAIMDDLALLYLAPEGITWISQGDPGITLGNMDFKWKPLKVCLDELGAATNQNWRIDAYRRLYFYSTPNVVAAPIDITEDDSGPNGESWRDMRVTLDRGLYRNRQYIMVTLPPTTTTTVLTYTKPTNVGGAFPVLFSDYLLTDINYSGRINNITRLRLNGVDIPYYMYGETPVAGWKYRQVTAGDLDLYWNWTAYTPPADGSTLEVSFTSTSEAPGPIYEEDAAEIAARAGVEEGSGVYEDVYDAGDITDEDTLREIALQLLAKFKYMGLEIDFETHVFGWEPGMVVTINLPSFTAGYSVPSELTVENVELIEEKKYSLLYRVKASNKVQQRDAMTAMARLIASLRRRSNSAPLEIQWELATDIPGFTNPGLEVLSAPGNAKVVRTRMVCDNIAVHFTDAPAGDDIELDIKRNGVSILTSPLVYPAGTSTVMTYNGFITNPVTLEVDDLLTIDILQVGSTSPGSNGTATIKGRG